MPTAKWFQILQCITNDSIKNQSFVYSQLNGQTILFLAIPFNIKHLFTHSLNVKLLYLTHHVLPISVRADLGEMVMKGYSSFPKAPGLTIKSFSVLLSAEMQPVYSTVLSDWGGMCGCVFYLKCLMYVSYILLKVNVRATHRKQPFETTIKNVRKRIWKCIFK